MTHKEFYFWLQGFLSGKGNLNASDILAIQKKMEKIKDYLTVGDKKTLIEHIKSIENILKKYKSYQ